MFMMLFVLSLSLYSKKLEVEIDAFTGVKTIYSDWEKIIWSMKQNVAVFTRFLYVDEEIILECSFIADTLNILIKSGQLLNVKFGNGQIINLKAIETTRARTGAGIGDFYADNLPAIRAKYSFKSQDDVDLFSSNLVSLIRINNGTTDEFEEVHKDITLKAKDGKKLQKAYVTFKTELEKLLTE